MGTNNFNLYQKIQEVNDYVAKEYPDGPIFDFDILDELKTFTVILAKKGIFDFKLLIDVKELFADTLNHMEHDNENPPTDFRDLGDYKNFANWIIDTADTWIRHHTAERPVLKNIGMIPAGSSAKHLLGN